MSFCSFRGAAFQKYNNGESKISLEDEGAGRGGRGGCRATGKWNFGKLRIAQIFRSTENLQTFLCSLSIY